MFNDIYRGKRVLVTGHAGFCGSWLCFWLKKLGAEVVGYGHAPRTAPNHFSLLNKGQFVFERDLLSNDLLDATMKKAKPDLVIHLAAKAIVARTFTEPRETFENNIMGAVNVLETCRQTPSVRGVIAITSDKVYANKEWNWGYRENDGLGGDDPYSISKVCVEHVITCYRKSFGMNIATARAGNIIGGGDWSEKRLIPDIVRAAAKGEKSIIHTPSATRPFQHVLEALQGYLLLGQHILEGKDVNGAYNFGPTEDISVLEILQIAKGVWGQIDWEIDDTPTHQFMVYLLKIDSTKSKKELGWESMWNIRETVGKTIQWYKAYYEAGNVTSSIDIDAYEEKLNAGN